jgi:hypothetical protein
VPKPDQVIRGAWGLASRSSLFLASFASARILVYVIPLTIAAMVPGSLYGAIEVALSISLLVASFTIAIPLAGANQQFLIARRKGMGHLFTMLAIVSAFLSLIVSWIFYIAGAQLQVQLITCAIGVGMFHSLFATWFRMHGMRIATAWSDGTATFIIGLIILSLVITDLPLTILSVAMGYTLLVTLLLAGTLLARMRVEKTDLRSLLLESCQIGLPMVAVGSMSIWLGIGGRIIVGIISFKDVAAYSLAFRVAGLALGVHQLAVTALFARLYRSPTRWADRVFSWFLLAATLVLAGLMLLGPTIMGWFEMNALERGGMEIFRRILPANCIQTLFWIGYAMLQMRINRYHLSSRAILPTAAVLAIGLAIIFGYGLLVSDDAVVVSWMVAAHSAALFAVNWLLLARARLPHRRLGLTMIAGTVILVFVTVITTLLTV